MTSSRKTVLVAHRGESADAPENTLAAFRLAWERGGTAIELDVHLSADGQAVVSHDFDTARVAGTKRVLGETPYTELRAYDAGAWKEEKYRGEYLPLLSEVFATVPPGGVVLVEIKCGAQIVPELVRCINASGLERGQIILICFNADVLQSAAAALPGCKTLLLDVVKRGAAGKADALVSTCIARHFDGVDLHFEEPATEEFVNRFHHAGLLVYTWTVNDADTAAGQVAAGIDGITSDCAARIRRELRERTVSVY